MSVMVDFYLVRSSVAFEVVCFCFFPGESKEGILLAQVIAYRYSLFVFLYWYDGFYLLFVLYGVCMRTLSLQGICKYFLCRYCVL